MNTLTTAALSAAARGWRVFPLRVGAKRPALHGVERCPRVGPCADGHQGWEQRATTNRDQVTRCWSADTYNIGLATGPSGLLVIDLDTTKPGDVPPPEWRAVGAASGADVLAHLAACATATLPATFTVATGTGGTHLYYRAPAGMRMRNTAGVLGWKVDTRAHGGYVVAAGSTVNGRTYTVTDDRDPVPLPGWLVGRLTPAPLPRAPVAPIRPTTGRRSRYLEAAIRSELARVDDAARSQRNSSLYVAALALGQLVAGGELTEVEVRHLLLTAAGRHIACGAYSQRQATQTITSGLRAGAKRPRRLAA
ncbi:MAG: bifunctional DNA primase/polymerase [Haloechinothrix sp.]